MKPCADFDKYCDKGLDRDGNAAFEAHLEDCPSCRAQVVQWRNIEREIVSTESQREAAQPKWNARVRERLTDPNTRRRSTRPALIVWAAAVAAMIASGAFVYLTMHKETESRQTQKTLADSVVITASIFTPDNLESTELVYPRDEALEAPGTGRILARIGEDSLGLEAHGRVRMIEIGSLTTRLVLERGMLACAVSSREKSGEFEIAAGRYTVRVLGTVFAVTWREEKGLQVDVSEGTVEVIGPGGGSWRVGSGQRLRVSAGESGVMNNVEGDDLKRIERLLSDVAIEKKDETENDEVDQEAAQESDADNEVIGGKEIEPQNKRTRATNTRSTSLDTWREWVINGRLDDAERSLYKHLQRSPTDEDAWWLFADCQRKAGKWQSALTSYLRVVDLTRGAEANRARFLAGSVAQDKLKKHAMAIELFENYLRIGKSGRTLEAEAMMRLARALIATGRSSRAKPILEEVIEKHGGTSAATGARRLLDKIE
ncbi:MAG: tetratricopeptide repeat protein [Deltaproteobacteria bacterium]|nr:tetratricopeptide repeat protein [Deltaproteobacteria bacterium]